MNMLHASVAELLTADQPKQLKFFWLGRDTDAMTETEIYKAALETWQKTSVMVLSRIVLLLLFGLPVLRFIKPSIHGFHDCL